MTEMNTSGFIELEHTADWSLRVWAPDLPGLLREAARGMYTLMEIESPGGQPVSRELELDALDAESLLVTFLSELLYDCEQNHAAYDEMQIEASLTHLQAKLSGAHFKQVRKEIKAVTYHKLAVTSSNGRLEVTIVFDV